MTVVVAPAFVRAATLVPPGHAPDAPRPLRAQRPVFLRPMLFHAAGTGYIAATVTKQEQPDPAAIPVARRVVLLVEPTLQLVAETWSDPATGAYRFNDLNPEARFTVQAYDHLGQWNAVIASNLAPKRTP